MSVVEVAAWIIVTRAVWQTLSGWGESKQKKIEWEAVRAEYKDLASGNYKIDKTLPEWMQKQHLARYEERKQQLLIRYPALLVEPPAGRYFKLGEEQYKEDNPPFRQELQEKWKWWLLAGVMCLVGYILAEMVKSIL